MNYPSLVILLLFALLRPTAGQAAERDTELYKVPGDNCLTFVALQKDSPVQFGTIDVLVKKKGGTPFFNWTLKNNSSKTVRRFEVAFKVRTNVERLQGIAGQTAYDIGTDQANDLILPQAFFTGSSYSWKPLPDDIRDWFESKNKRDERKYVVVYAIIKKVVFSDGTVYEDNDKIFGSF